MHTPMMLERILCGALIGTAFAGGVACAAASPPATSGATLATAAPVPAMPASPASPSPTETPAADDSGMWQKHEYSFAFLGFTSTYSCDGLADKLKLLLIASGARPDAKARAGACASGFGRPDKFARADLTFYTLKPAGLSPPDPVATGAAKTPDTTPVGGVWAPVDVAEHQPRELGRGDCELVEQFRSSVLPLFATRQIEDRTTCIPHQESGSVISLKFESFRLPPKPAAKAG